MSPIVYNTVKAKETINLLKTEVVVYIVGGNPQRSNIAKSCSSNTTISTVIPRPFHNKTFMITACRQWINLPGNIRSIDGSARLRAEVKEFLLRGLRDLRLVPLRMDGV